MTYDFDDILIMPADITDINSRSEVNPFYGSKLPLFAAPMDTVVNRDNIQSFLDAGIKVCLPREGSITPHHYSLNEDVFYAYSLADFRAIFLGEHHIKHGRFYVLIDVANGHMPAVRDAVVESKAIYGERLQLMVGNIANPDTYNILSQAGADYIRVGIGNGGGCLTTQQTGVGYPMASLIEACFSRSMELSTPAKIVADGGFKKYADVIKALAMGADYVMLGSILNKSLESAGENYVQVNGNRDYISYSDYHKSFEPFVGRVDPLNIPTPHDLMTHGTLYKKFRGMSTKEAQKSLGNDILKTSEGVVKYQKVEYTLKGWCDNFEHYLRSAMSYTNRKELVDFIGNVHTVRITPNAYNRYNK
jgi:IMP dehydrogenase/GMP reductase